MLEWIGGLLGSGTPQPAGAAPEPQGGPALLEALLSPAGQSRARSNAMTALGAQLLAASGPSTTPQSFGSAAGRGALAYLGARQGEEDSAIRRAYLGQQVRNMQMAERRQATEMESAQALERALAAAAGVPMPTTPAAPGQGAPGAAPGGQGGPAPMPDAGAAPRAPGGPAGGGVPSPAAPAGAPALNIPPAVARSLLALPPAVRQQVLGQIVAQQARPREAAPVNWQLVEREGRTFAVNPRDPTQVREVPLPAPPAPEPTLGNNERGNAARILTTVAPRVLAGTATPQEIEMFRAAGEVWQAQRFDPGSGTYVQGMALPPVAAEAFRALSGAQPPQGAAAPPDGAAPQTERTNTGSERTPPPQAQGTEGERLAAGFAMRMQESGQILRDLETRGYDPTNLRDIASQRLPGGNYVMSREGQMYRQAAENWVRANLRRESGAVIGAEEMDREIKTYFPQPGDDPDVIEQKARARAVTERNMIRSAGRAWQLQPAAPDEQRPGFDSRLPDAPREPGQRRAGTTYNTSDGPMRWNGTAWDRPGSGWSIRPVQ